MNQSSSRKQFFAKLLGAAAAASVLPKALANPGDASPTHQPAVKGGKLQLRAEARAVARRDMI